MKVISVLLTLIFLSACGQGENGSSTDGGSSIEGSSSTRTVDLKVSPDFNFIGGETLTIRIVNEGSSSERLYLNICSDFNQVDGQYQVNYGGCILRTSIQSQYGEYEINLSSNEQELLAQVWPLVDGASPESYLWYRLVDGNDWQITVF